MTGNVGFVDLHDIRVNTRNLFGEDLRESHREARRILVVTVQERAREHVWTSDRKFEPGFCERANALIRARQIERPCGERAFDDGGRTRTELHRFQRAELL